MTASSQFRHSLGSWLVHAYTASGVVLAFLMFVAVMEGDTVRALWLFLASMVVDGTDGMLARRVHHWGWPLLDAQVENPHLFSLGGEAWPRPRFLETIAGLVDLPGVDGSWEAAFGAPWASELAESQPR